ncbi:MAG: hypothetical protein O3B24_05175 [Verrucomicrobia bacterium]|nr:hypothetical protein [Verrucomicrobiota bacterium]
MRTFLAYANLRQALPIATLVTLLSTPRLIAGQVPLLLYISTTFTLMLLTAGVVTAWGGTGGLSGAFPPPPRQHAAFIVACLLALALLPLHWLWLDPLMRAAIVEAGPGPLLALAYPTTAAGIAAKLLWSAGFEILCLQAAPVALAARLTGRWWLGILVAVAARTWAANLHLAHYQVLDHHALVLTSTAAGTLAGGLLFARGGLLPAMLFGAAMQLHLLLPPR